MMIYFSIIFCQFEYLSVPSATPVDDDARHMYSHEAHRLVGKSHVTAGEPSCRRDYAMFRSAADGAI